MEGAGTWHETAGASAPCWGRINTLQEGTSDLLPMQLLLFPEILHLLCFLPKGLCQLDVTLSHVVYLCKEKINDIYIPKEIVCQVSLEYITHPLSEM